MTRQDYHNDRNSLIAYNFCLCEAFFPAENTQQAKMELETTPRPAYQGDTKQADKGFPHSSIFAHSFCLQFT